MSTPKLRRSAWTAPARCPVQTYKLGRCNAPCRPGEYCPTHEVHWKRIVARGDKNKSLQTVKPRVRDYERGLSKETVYR